MKATPDAKMPTRSTNKQCMLREIKAAKQLVMSYSGCLPLGVCLDAMEQVASVATIVAAGKWYSPEGWKAVYEMCRSIVTLKRMN